MSRQSKSRLYLLLPRPRSNGDRGGFASRKHRPPSLILVKMIDGRSHPDTMNSDHESSHLGTPLHSAVHPWYQPVRAAGVCQRHHQSAGIFLTSNAQSSHCPVGDRRGSHHPDDFQHLPVRLPHPNLPRNQRRASRPRGPDHRHLSSPLLPCGQYPHIFEAIP